MQVDLPGELQVPATFKPEPHPNASSTGEVVSLSRLPALSLLQVTNQAWDGAKMLPSTAGGTICILTCRCLLS